jgi:hypothetical protein
MGLVQGELLQALDLRFGPPEKIAHHAYPLWGFESRREPTLYQICGV